MRTEILRRSIGARTAMLAVSLIGVLGMRSAEACGVCFTGDGTVMTTAVNGMLFAMLGAVVLVLGAFFAFIIYLARCERQAGAAPEAQSGEA